MFDLFKNIFLAYFISFIVISPCYAGDIMTKGTVLSEDSYVFSIDEATDLLNRIEELEKKEQQLDLYIELDLLQKEKERMYQSNIDLYSFQITEYQNIMRINQDEILRLEKRNKYRWLENYGMLAIGIGLTIGAFVTADHITDHMESR